MPLSIYKKGLLIVFIPLAVNMAWIGMYWHSLKESSNLLDLTVANGNVMFLMSQSIGLFNKTAICLFDFVKNSGEQSAKTRARQESLELLKTLNLLSVALAPGSRSRVIVDNLSVSLSYVRETLDVLADKPDLSEQDIVALHLPQKFSVLMNEIHSLLRMFDDSNKTFDNTLDTQETDIRTTRFIVMTGLLLNLSIALALALYFKLSIVKRISDVSIKARNLISDTAIPLDPIVNDELSVLDYELRESKKKLIEADKFRRLYMTAVAQRLQISLRRCMQSSSLLEQDQIVVEKGGDKYLKRLNASLSSCLALIDDLVLLESLDIGNLRLKIEIADLKGVVDDSIEVISNLATAKDVRIENRCQESFLPVDAARIKQVLVNLLSNAIKFSKSGSSIAIACEKGNSFLRVSVIDQGPGIEKQVSAKLFQKFFQTSEGKSAGGTGLGLAIAKLIVESHGGIIGVDSTVGEGSTFWFELPLRGSSDPG